MTPWPAARRIAYAAGVPLPVVELPLGLAVGAVLAGPLVARWPLPAVDTAAMDGWAVRGPGPWQVVGRVLAGDPPPGPLAVGQAVEIATGAGVPGGAEGVVPYEDGAITGAAVNRPQVRGPHAAGPQPADRELIGRELIGQELTGPQLTGPHPVGRHVRLCGDECAAGEQVLPAGLVLSPVAAGLAAALGHDTVAVHGRPRVSALVTGTELLPTGRPGGSRIRDALGPLLPSSIACWGGELTSTTLLPDDRNALLRAVADAAGDVVLTSGASSVGPADHLAGVLEQLGARTLIDGVAVKPGHPQLLARLADGRLLVGLPGNPLAALSGLVTLVAPLLAALSGRPEPPLSSAELAAPLDALAVHRLVPVRLDDGRAWPTGHGGAAMLRGAATAQAFAVVDPGRPLAAGDQVALAWLPSATLPGSRA